MRKPIRPCGRIRGPCRSCRRRLPSPSSNPAFTRSCGDSGLRAKPPNHPAAHRESSTSPTAIGRRSQKECRFDSDRPHHCPSARASPCHPTRRRSRAHLLTSPVHPSAAPPKPSVGQRATIALSPTSSGRLSASLRAGTRSPNQNSRQTIKCTVTVTRLWPGRPYTRSRYEAGDPDEMN